VIRKTGTTSLLVSLGVHGVLLAGVVLCIGETTSTPPRIHLVYGEVGSESSRGEIWKAGAEKPPQIQVEQQAPPGSLTDAMDAQLMGGAVSKLGDSAGSVATPLLMTADGAGGAIFGSDASVTPKFSFKAPSFPSSDSANASSGRAGASSGTDVASIPQPIYPKESRQRGEQGTVLLEVEIKSDGSIGHIKVLEHPGHERLVNAAIEAIKKARIEPALEDGRPIASTVRVPFNFVLR
jgi:TonB family protein